MPGIVQSIPKESPKIKYLMECLILKKSKFLVKILILNIFGHHPIVWAFFPTITLIFTRNCKRDGECEGLEGQFLCSNGLCHNMTRVVDCQYNITGQFRCFDQSFQIFCRCIFGLQRQTQLHHPGGDAPVYRGHLPHPGVALQLHKVTS